MNYIPLFSVCKRDLCPYYIAAAVSSAVTSEIWDRGIRWIERREDLDRGDGFERGDGGLYEVFDLLFSSESIEKRSPKLNPCETRIE